MILPGPLIPSEVEGHADGAARRSASLGMEGFQQIQAWDDALTAAQLLALDPAALGGIHVRSGDGPVRDLWLAHLRACLGAAPVCKVPVTIADERLLGGLDLGATLAADRQVVRRGVLAEADGGVVLLAMAERLTEASAGRLAAVLDTGMVALERDGISLQQPANVAMIALDEGIEDERIPAALAERLALRLDLTGIAWRDAEPPEPGAADLAAARALLPQIAPATEADLQALCVTAAAYGIDSARAPIFALRAAAASAALDGHTRINTDDLILAARLVLLPRATRLPQQQPEPAEPQSETPEPPPERDPGDADTSLPTPSDLTEILLAAVASTLPPGLLAALDGGKLRGPAAGRGKGALRAAMTRGRPLAPRAGDPRLGARLDLIATLRAAAPWQPLRRREAARRGSNYTVIPAEAGIHRPNAGEMGPRFREDEGSVPNQVRIRRDDFRIKRFAERAESTTIFIVDASGSAALGRLAEAKGAVELLLAEAYVRRTQVALIAFRGVSAELLLPPTRSLARAKRSLGDLPGGGGTPLASALDMGLALAAAARGRGRTPFIVLLTDGRANIARDGTSARDTAVIEATDAAQAVRRGGIASAFLDTAPRPRPEAAALAAAMGARYVPLPRVDAGAMRDLVKRLA